MTNITYQLPLWKALWQHQQEAVNFKILFPHGEVGTAELLWEKKVFF